MVIAAAINTDDENFFWHFGHCERFKIYEIDGESPDAADRSVRNVYYITVTGGHGPQRLQAMIENGVNVILSDGMGPGVAQAAIRAGIQIVAGVKGNADDAVQRYLDGELVNDEAGVRPCGMD